MITSGVLTSEGEMEHVERNFVCWFFLNRSSLHLLHGSSGRKKSGQVTVLLFTEFE